MIHTKDDAMPKRDMIARKAKQSQMGNRLFLFLLCFFLSFPLFSKTRVVEFHEIDKSGAQAITPTPTLTMEILNKSQLHAFILSTLGSVEKEDTSAALPTFTTPYPLQESSILTFNEPKALLGYIQIIRYYIDHAYKILKFNKRQQPKILIRIARGNSSFALFELIQKALTELYGDNYKIYTDHQNIVYRGVYITGQNVYLHYRTSTDIFPKFMENFDIVITIGGANTLSTTLSPGTFLIPEKTIPIRLNERLIDLKRISPFNNDLTKRLPKILEYTKGMDAILTHLNKDALSPNTLKKEQKADTLQPTDFQSPLILTTPDKIVQNEGDELFRIVEK